MIGIILIILIGSILFIAYKMGYENGYNKREEEMQGNPIQFIIGNTPVVHISRKDP